MDSATLNQRFAAWIGAEQEVRQKLANRFGLNSARVDVQSAAMAVLNVEDAVSLLDREWTASEIASAEYLDKNVEAGNVRSD